MVPEFPESHPEATERVGEAARPVAAATEDTVLLVGHGITVAGVVAGLVGSADEADAPLCGPTRIERDGDQRRLDVSGDTAHLDA